MKTDIRTRRRALFASAAAPAIALALMATSVQAQEPAKAFSIAPQPLADALLQLSRQADVDIVASTDLTRGRTAPRVDGEMTTADAMSVLLAGSGLVAAPSGTGYVIARASDPQSGSAAGDGADQGTVQALIVTAQKREENIQDVPIAMSAFTQEDLTRSQVAGGPDLITQVPNMTFTKTNFTSYSIQIRGIGTQAISATTDPAVAVAFNNTPFLANHFFEQEFYDMERVEVLRGPQGTLYGRNATAGVVNLISAKPKNHFEAKLSGDVSNYNSSRLEGMINIPLVEDKAALRIAGEWTKRDGFVKNILTGQQTDGRDLWSGRVTLGLTPTENFSANLIYEHFAENDDRLRSGKQLCRRDPGLTQVGDTPIRQDAYPLQVNASYLSQGCLPASLYSPDAFQTPNGYALPYYGPASAIGSPVYGSLDPYASRAQSRNLREIETHIVPDYEASSDVVELQWKLKLGHDLTLASETGFSHDFIFSFEDYNRFDTTPNVFVPGGSSGNDFSLVSAQGVFCDPQLGCTNRLAAGDLATAKSKQFSQEFRLSSDYEGPVNFSVGANFLRYDTEVKYYVFINSLTAYAAGGHNNWIPGVTSHQECFTDISRTAFTNGLSWSDPNAVYGMSGCTYIDPNNIHNLNDEGRNYFLSKNPYHLLSYSAFGEVYYQVTPALKLTGGFRWTVDKKTAPQIPSWLIASDSYGTATRKTIDQEWREPTGRLAIDWKPTLSFTDDTLLYASYVRGYKAGGANPPPPVMVAAPVGGADRVAHAAIQNSLVAPQTFAPEFVNAYEIGTKSTLLDGKLVFNLNGFYYDYTGYQISEIVNRSAVNLNFDAKIWGSELEADWRPMENLRLGLKLGYENTRLAKGSQAIDLMDRVAGQPGWALFKPFPPQASNCVVPDWLVQMVAGSYVTGLCAGYIGGVDPLTALPYTPYPTQWRDASGQTNAITPSTVIGGVSLYGYRGYDPSSANNGEGFPKDLSGNSLPNAPHYTATITADYTLPLPNEWLMTLHTDLYYQSEAWTRVFNDPGYDKLKAYNNINVAAIFSNQDAGWQVMAYVKNVLDKANITGAFLNSDDSGLTTNVFLTEPRLYGLRVTKTWSDNDPFGSLFLHKAGEPYPFRIEIDGIHGPLKADHEVLMPATTALFTPDLPFSSKPQRDMGWGSDGGAKITYSPNPNGWDFSVSARYGRATANPEAHASKGVTGLSCRVNYSFTNCLDTATGAHIITVTGQDPFISYYITPVKNYASSSVRNDETRLVADIDAGHSFTLPSWSNEPIGLRIEAGLRYAKFKSNSTAMLGGRTGLYYPPDNPFVNYTLDKVFFANLAAHRSFEGAGPAISWNAALPLVGRPEAGGAVALEVGLGGSVLVGKQTAEVKDDSQEYDLGGLYWYDNWVLSPPVISTFQGSRSKQVTVPSVDASLGLSYTLGGLKVSGGYRMERYFNVIDGGLQTAKKYDRDLDGVYAKISLGFGG